ncbi:lipopolysaccharide biosynthesis protein [Micromonospora sp. NPDC005299]|uniref:lipopolysaccharide biosynthesis protein n=1 Tax=Micromonospora sp. NPDC005299 TaxID=3364231 RepID=UPI0036822862
MPASAVKGRHKLGNGGNAPVHVRSSGRVATAQNPPRHQRVRSVGAQAVMLAFASGLAQLLVAGVYILAARGTAPADFGVVVTSVAIGTAGAGLLDLGTNAFWMRELSRNAIAPSDLGARVRTKLAVGALVAASWGITVAWFQPTLSIAGAILFAVAASQTMLVPLRATKRGGTVALLLVLERLVAVAVFALLTLSGASTQLSLWISLAVGSISMAVVAYSIQARHSRLRLTGRGFANPWRGTRHYGLSSLALSAQQFDLPILGAVAGATAAGIYGGVNRWTQPMGLLATAFSSAAAPFVAGATDWKSARQHVMRAAWVLALGIAACCVIILVAPKVVEMLLGQEYAGSAPVLRWLAAGTVLTTLNQPLASFLQSRAHEDMVAYVLVGSVAMQLCLVVALGSTMGAEGAAVAYCVLQLGVFASLAICMRAAYRRENGRARE